MFVQFYGLKEQPFGVTPDPRFLYMGPTHQEAFASLVYGIETGRGFMALIAPPGLGKTTLLLRLIEQLRHTALTAFLFQSHTNSQEFLKNLLLDLDVKPLGQDMSEWQGQLREVLVRGSESGKRVVLAIDEAQNLDDSVLEMVRMLSNFETPQAKLLQTIIAGQPALADKLAKPHLAQLRQRISIVAHFPPLPSKEVAKYVCHRLAVAGYKGGRLFSPGAMELIARYSRGIPRVINNLCFNALSIGYAKGLKRVDEPVLREVITDLNLEFLGERRGHRRPAAAPVTVGRSQGDSASGPRTTAPVLDIGPQRSESVGTGWGSPDFFDYAPDWLGAGDSGFLYSRSVAEARGRPKHGALIVILMAAAIVGLFMWKPSWLRPGLDALDRVVISSAPQKPDAPANPPAANSPSAPPPPQGTQIQDPADASNAGEKIDLPDGDEGSPQKAAASDEEARSPDNSGDSLDAKLGDPLLAAVERGTCPVIPYRLQAKEQPVSALRARRSLREAGTAGPHGELVLQSNVSGARISINGQRDPDWVTPHLFYLPPGDYRISISRGGYSTWTRRVHLSTSDKWLMAELRNNENGIFTVETTPPGMQVFIDGRPYGASRVETVLQPGWHICEVIPVPGSKPVVGKFHLGPGEALTRRIRVTEPAASSAPYRPPRTAGTLRQGTTTSSQGERLE